MELGQCETRDFVYIFFPLIAIMIIWSMYRQGGSSLVLSPEAPVISAVPSKARVFHVWFFG
jgi:hypothetical protein